MSSFDGTQPVVDLPPSSSGLLVDSKGRKTNESPYSFTANFTSAIRGDLITYSAFQWCQPIYAHTGVSAAFYFDLFLPDSIYAPDSGSWYPATDNDDDFLNSHYVVYHKPYCCYTNFDGNENNGMPYQPPQVGSYASDLEVALNTDVRLSTNNLVPIDLSDTFKDISFQFRYSASQGFRLTATYTDEGSNATIPLGIRLFPSPSISKAHRVHGFGMECNWDPLDVNRGIVRTQSDYTRIAGGNNKQKIWLPNWLASLANTPVNNTPVNIDLSSNIGLSYVLFSDLFPTLIPIEYIQIFSPELTFQRKLPSFRNTAAQCQYGNDEMAIFPTTLDSIGVYKLLVADEDANVWSFREDYAPQTAQFIITDEDGVTLTGSNIMTKFFQLRTNAVDITTYQLPFVDYAQNYRSPGAMNYLLFGVASITTSGQFLNPTDDWGSPSGVALDCDVVHYLQVINA